EEARDQNRPERGMIDVRVAGHDQDVELIPSARFHLRARRRQKSSVHGRPVLGGAELREGHQLVRCANLRKPTAKMRPSARATSPPQRHFSISRPAIDSSKTTSCPSSSRANARASAATLASPAPSTATASPDGTRRTRSSPIHKSQLASSDQTTTPI